MDGRTASLRPSDAIPDPQILNINDDKSMSKIHRRSLEWITQAYVAPPSDPNAYLKIQYAPVAWLECVELISVPHLALHAFCLASADKNLQELFELRSRAKELCRGSGDEGNALWLRSRPSFIIQLTSDPKTTQLNIWSWELKKKLTGLADRHGLRARAVMLVYAAESLLSSSSDLGGWRTLLKRKIVDAWDEQISIEIADLKRIFGLGGPV